MLVSGHVDFHNRAELESSEVPAGVPAGLHIWRCLHIRHFIYTVLYTLAFYLHFTYKKGIYLHTLHFIHICSPSSCHCLPVPGSCCQPVAQSILKFDSCVFKASKLQAFTRMRSQTLFVHVLGSEELLEGPIVGWDS